MTEQDLTQLPASRKDAVASGLPYYFTGMPCKNGHVSKRYALHRSCFQCGSERNITPKRKLYMSDYRLNNKNKIKDLNKKWFSNNKDYHHEYQKKYREENIDKVRSFARDRVKKYREAHPERMRAHESKRRQCEGVFNEKDVKKILGKQKYKCINCLCSVKKKYHVDHLMPVKLGGTNWPENLQILCPKCNLSKNAKHPLEWAKKNGRLL